MKARTFLLSVLLITGNFLFAQSSNEKLTTELAKTAELSSQVTRMIELDRIAAKAMTIKEAYENIALYHKFGIISIAPAPKFNNDGSVIFPAVIPKITMNKLDATGTHVKFTYDTNDYAVAVFYNPYGAPPPRNDIVQIVHNKLDVRNVAAFTRMLIYLAMEKNVTQVHHSGMRGSDRSDCHGEGRAVDFVGVVFADGGTMFVGKNWSSKKVLKLPGFTDQATSNEWPAKSQVLHFRLDHSNADQNAMSFFSDLYEFIQIQYQDKSSGPGDTGGSLIGQRSFIMHPDHYLSSTDSGTIGRETHKDHIHMQIGVTGKSN